LFCSFKNDDTAEGTWDIKPTKAFKLSITKQCDSTSALSATKIGVPAAKYNAITFYDSPITIDPTTLFNYHGDKESGELQKDWAPSKCPIDRCEWDGFAIDGPKSN